MIVLYNPASVQKGRLPPVRIELTAFSLLFECLDYETDALPTELKGLSDNRTHNVASTSLRLLFDPNWEILHDPGNILIKRARSSKLPNARARVHFADGAI
jgi:hypothetical protein